MKPFAAIACISVAALCGCATSPEPSSVPSREDIYILHSIRERTATDGNWCDASRTGFTPMATDAERLFSFWSVQSEPASGRVLDASARRVAELRGCFGSTSERTRQNFFAEVRLGAISFQGIGECFALLVDVPEPGLYGVRCHLVLRDLPRPYVAGLLTTNTLTSRTPFGSDTDPPGYTQASIATIRLWRDRSAEPGQPPLQGETP